MSEAEVEYLDVEDLVDLARLLLGSPHPIRDMGLLGSAAARPQTTVFGEDAYPDVWTKAAALLQSVVKDHPLIDGNKRLGWLSTAVFLELNGVATHRASNDDVYEFVIGIAAGASTIEQIAEDLRRLVRWADETGSRTRAPRLRPFEGRFQGGPVVDVDRAGLAARMGGDHVDDEVQPVQRRFP